ENGKTILRGNYGRAHRSVFPSDFTNIYPGISTSTLARWDPATNSYSTIISVTNPTANLRVDSNLNSPFTDQYSIGVDHELRANVGVSATYVHKHGQDQVGWKDLGGVYGTQAVVLANGQTLNVVPLSNGT